MDVTKTVNENLCGPIPDPLKPHTPMHTHHQMKVGAVNVEMGHGMSSGSESGSNSGDGEGESDVSDMVIDNSSKFAALSKKRRKSGESDYVPHEDSRSPESQSESESDSHSEQSEEESDTSAESRGPPQKPPAHTLVRRLSDESDRSSSSSQLTPQQKQRQQLSSTGGVRMSPLIKRGSHSPFTKSNTRNILNDVSMRKYNYELCPPKRRAALNAKYTFDDENDSDDVGVRHGYQPSRARRRRSPSGSEYEASDQSSAESSSEDSFVVEDESDDDYRPTKRSGRSGPRGRRGRVRNECSISLHEKFRWFINPKAKGNPFQCPLMH